MVLELGGTVGAAVITASARFEGEEIEIRPTGAPWNGRHVAFHRRHTATGDITAAVFPNLAQGDWEARLHGLEAGATALLHVEGGRVTTLAFPEDGP